MTTLAEMPFKALRAGMRFRHPEHGEQVILDLGQGTFGPAIWFHDSDMYSGQLPQMDLDEEGDIFQAIAQSTFPYGAEDWEYLGMVNPEQVAEYGWQWFQAACPHCGFAHRLLAKTTPPNQRRCLACGMVFVRPAEPVLP